MPSGPVACRNWILTRGRRSVYLFSHGSVSFRRAVDRIAELANRAARRLPLFPNGKHSEAVLEYRYWTAKNGWRHLVALVRLVAGQPVKQRSRPPYLNPAWVKYCQTKRDYRAKWKAERGEEFRRQELRHKRRSRERLGHN